MRRCVPKSHERPKRRPLNVPVWFFILDPTWAGQCINCDALPPHGASGMDDDPVCWEYAFCGEDCAVSFMERAYHDALSFVRDLYGKQRLVPTG